MVSLFILPSDFVLKLNLVQQQFSIIKSTIFLIEPLTVLYLVYENYITIK